MELLEKVSQVAAAAHAPFSSAASPELLKDPLVGLVLEVTTARRPPQPRSRPLLIHSPFLDEAERNMSIAQRKGPHSQRLQNMGGVDSRRLIDIERWYKRAAKPLEGSSTALSSQPTRPHGGRRLKVRDRA